MSSEKASQIVGAIPINLHRGPPMPLQTANWEPNKDLPVGKGATIQQFFTTLGKDRFEINVAPRGAKGS